MEASYKDLDFQAKIDFFVMSNVVIAEKGKALPHLTAAGLSRFNELKVYA
jgi:hypothetical protein